MAKGIQDIANGRGLIYVTKPDGSTIVKNLRNTENGYREVKLLGLQGASVALNRRATGKITITLAEEGSTFTSVTVGGAEQLNRKVTITASDTKAEIAKALADAITSYDRGDSDDYTAITDDAVIWLISSEEKGSSDNGDRIDLSQTGDTMFTTTDVSGGSDQSKVHDESFGYRFYLDADYDTSGCSGEGDASEGDKSNATEITNYVITRGYESAILEEDVAPSSGSITIIRTSSVMSVKLDTAKQTATDNLTNITPEGFADNDLLIITGKDKGRVTTVNTNSVGNIVLQNSNFKTGDNSKTLVLRYEGGTFYEVSRSTQTVGSRSDFRSAGFPFSVHGTSTFTIPTNGTVTFDPNADEKYQKTTTTGILNGDVTIELKDGTAKKGDTFIIEYNASVTVNGNSVRFTGTGSGEPLTLTDNEALNGNLTIYAYYGNNGWEFRSSYDLNKGALLQKTHLSNSIIGATQVEGPLRIDHLTHQASFEANEVGDTKKPIWAKGTVTRIEVRVTQPIAGTDDGTIDFKNDSGVSMGTLTIPKNSTHDTSFVLVPSSNNTFAAGEYINAVTSKTTKGGRMEVNYRLIKDDA